MINFQTHNSVIVHYPRYAGGKFISNCLSLSQYTVPQHKKLAEYLLVNPANYNYRFANLLKTLPPRSDIANWATRYELGDRQLFNNVIDTHWRHGYLGNEYANEITIKLSNSKLKFFIVSHDGPEEIKNLLKVWPNSSIVMLTNHAKFRKIAAKLKGVNIDSDTWTGNYCKSKFDLLAGPEWPSWEKFESCKYNIKNLIGYPKHILDEMEQYYIWHTVDTSPMLFDVDNCIFDKDNFLLSMYQLYQYLNLNDFNSQLIGNFWQAYIDLHIDNRENL